MSYHPTVLTFFFTIEVSVIRRHSSLSWWGRSSVLCMCWLTRGVSMVLVIWLLCLKSSSCWGELLFVVALICYGRLWISRLLLSIECHWRGECRSVLGWEPVASLIKTLKLWDKLSVWWSWWFAHGSNKSFILRTKTCEKTKYIFFVWNQFPNCCKAVQETFECSNVFSNYFVIFFLKICDLLSKCELSFLSLLHRHFSVLPIQYVLFLSPQRDQVFL